MPATNFLLVKNYGVGTLAAELGTASPGTGTLNSGNGANFPASGTFNVVVYPADGDPVDGEIVQVTARSSDELTLTKSAESTTNKVHPAGSLVKLVMTAGYLSQVQTAIANIETGTKTLDALNVSGTATLGTTTNIGGQTTITHSATNVGYFRRGVNALNSLARWSGQMLNGSGNAYLTYGEFSVAVIGTTAGTEQGGVRLSVLRNGTLTAAMSIDAGASMNDVRLYNLPTSTTGTANRVWNSSGTLRID